MGRRANRAAAPGDTPGVPPRSDPARAEWVGGPEPSTLAGYRVVRRLGSGRRAVVYLGHAGRRAEPGDETGGLPVGSLPVTVALKVFDPETDPASIEREVRALSQSPAGLLPGLLDVATLPDGRVCLVLERLAGASLNRRLAGVDALRPGEAVTILAPMVTALSALHEAGFAHVGFSLASVLFDERGRPVLAGLGGLRDLPPAGVARIPALRANYLRLGVLTHGVLDCLDPADPAAPAAGRLTAWFDEAAGAVPFRPCLDELERRLFGWAAATPVRAPGPQDGEGVGGAAVRAQAGRAALRIEARHGRVRGAHAGAAGSTVGPSTLSPQTVRPQAVRPPTVRPQAVRHLAARLLELHLPPEVRTAVLGALDGHHMGRTVARLRDKARPHRRPLWLAGVVAAGLVLLATGLLPARTGTEASGPGGADTDASGRQPAGGAGRASAAVGEGRDSLEAPELAALSGDEPVLAVPVLLALRAGCLAAASVVCLDGVDQPGSAVMAADTYSARSAQQGGAAADAPTFERHTVSLVERSGNSALVALAPPGDQAPPGEQAGPHGQPASVLVVRGEAGWRLREIFDYYLPPRP
ncbi:hypothetical protein [Cryobacterium tagatosivorans]|uniref:Protein kinase domain-containing protein n=1 Tax=Cryobacterium tagatosivorans TaxID=1259199 RepID=A0A4R8UG71_9MICO|nr:hypothetical protein [Cryobacterium tagatosivorans]TFB51358.1 hypothetical protein E3O23_08580 [Cryobacterium tagatosivorans]